MKRKMKIFLLGLLALLAMPSGLVRAEGENINLENVGEEKAMVVSENTSRADFEKNGMKILAWTVIRDGKVVSQENNNFVLEFEIFNNLESVQSGIKYGVFLVSKDEKTGIQNMEDYRIYDETINLAGKSGVKKKIEYTAPKNLNGKFDFWVIGESNAGLSMGSFILGEIELKGNATDFVNIISDSCYLKVLGDEKKFILGQGVDVKPEETLLLSCDVKNMFSSEKQVISQMEIFDRTVFGEKVLTKENLKVGLPSGQIQRVEWKIPLPQKSQAYDAVLELKDEQGKVISNKIEAHFVLKGASGTIQNVNFDKDQYSKGEKALLEIFATPSADDFPGSRFPATKIDKMFLSVIIKDYQGKNCSDSKEIEIIDDSAKAEIEIIKDCVNPTLETVLKDGQGNVLDQEKFSIEKDLPEAQKEDQGKGWTLAGYGAIVIFSLAIASILLIVFRKKPEMTVLLIFFFSLLTIGGSEKALGYSSPIIKSSEQEWTYSFADYHIAGDDIVISGSLGYDHCANASRYLKVYAAIVTKPFNQVDYGKEPFLLTSVTAIGMADVLGGKWVPYSGKINGKWTSELNGNYYMWIKLYDKWNNLIQSYHPITIEKLETEISGPETGFINTPYTFSLLGKPSRKMIRFMIDWDMDEKVDETWPVIDNSTSYNYAVSGFPRSVSHQWSTPGLKTFQARFMTEWREMVSSPRFSPWTRHSINIDESKIPPACIGPDPVNASPCDDYNSGLTVDIPKVAVSTCGSSKCEYLCNSGYELKNGTCVLKSVPLNPGETGICGGASTKPSCQVPTSDLCKSGQQPSIVKLKDDKIWTWTCSDGNVGGGAPCYTLKSCAQREVNP